jgi:hypothetical protein
LSIGLCRKRLGSAPAAAGADRIIIRPRRPII